MTNTYLRPLALAAVAGALALSAPSSAQEPETAGSGEAAAADTKAEDKKLICRTEKVIGSRAKRRKTCLTRAQWEQVARKGNAFSRALVANAATGMWDGAPDTPGN
ncbi:hypothetical protein [Qipengyuania flava]|uniref:hypothetical protein n=1 Tax=Qipengyuania flava TaxID=192812 RepID=UPI001C628DC3|nr:hypothetical protein [Qipengyuania flava]QYJ07992.1 hypothetical protein KUV82_04600 [Qipengyuania flava]